MEIARVSGAGALERKSVLASRRIVRVWGNVVLVGLALLTGSCAVTHAQVDATHWRSGMVDIDSGWRAHDGDNLVWAQTNFDDRAWPTVELDTLGAAQPGWHWYRLHVTLAPDHPHLHLLIAGGPGTYELYVNGERQPGSEPGSAFGVRRPTEQIFSLNDADTSLEIALRARTPGVYTAWQLPLFLTAGLGTPGAIDNLRLALQSQRLYGALPSIAINLVLILAGVGAFALYRSQRHRAEYWWLGCYLFLLGLSNLLSSCSAAGLLPLMWNNLLGDPLIYLFTIMQIQFTFSFAGQRIGRVWRAYEILLLLPLALVAPIAAGIVPGSLGALIEAVVILPAALLLPVLLFVWFRRGNREAVWLILPSLLPAATAALFDVGSVSLYTGWGYADFLTNGIPLGPVSVQLADAGDFLFLLAIAVVMFFRFTRVSREQARAAAELDAAREIQQRLVPAQIPEVAGYAIEAAYFPAEEVGGDFYQVLASGDEARLVVVGDVSGKGLKAAMTGTLALGALRTLAAEGLGPAAVLARLNRQIAETGEEGFITCLCARVAELGDVTIANAGHLPPYRNGEEVVLESGLPLGILPDTVYVEQRLTLAPGDRLTMLSDGVLEARDVHGALFGFERVQAISAQPAEEIAAAAQSYGQEDDITVLTLTRATPGEAVALRLGTQGFD